jgi:hypothetical protein
VRSQRAPHSPVPDSGPVCYTETGSLVSPPAPGQQRQAPGIAPPAPGGLPLFDRAGCFGTARRQPPRTAQRSQLAPRRDPIGSRAARAANAGERCERCALDAPPMRRAIIAGERWRTLENAGERCERRARRSAPRAPRRTRQRPARCPPVGCPATRARRLANEPGQRRTSPDARRGRRRPNRGRRGTLENAGERWRTLEHNVSLLACAAHWCEPGYICVDCCKQYHRSAKQLYAGLQQRKCRGFPCNCRGSTNSLKRRIRPFTDANEAD